jgi:hypothetical protein
VVYPLRVHVKVIKLLRVDPQDLLINQTLKLTTIESQPSRSNVQPFGPMAQRDPLCVAFVEVHPYQVYSQFLLDLRLALDIDDKSFC